MGGTKIIPFMITPDMKENVRKIKLREGRGLSPMINEMIEQYVEEDWVNEPPTLKSANIYRHGNRSGISLAHDLVPHMNRACEKFNRSRASIVSGIVCEMIDNYDFDLEYTRQEPVKKACISVSQEAYDFIGQYSKEEMRSRTSFAAMSYMAYKRNDITVMWKEPKVHRGSGVPLNGYFRSDIAEGIRDLAEEKELSISEVHRYLVLTYARHLKQQKAEAKINEQW